MLEDSDRTKFIPDRKQFLLTYKKVTSKLIFPWHSAISAVSDKS